jgi:hypothetical protein
MGVNTTFCLIYGIKVKEKKFEKKKIKVRGCFHNIDEKNNFCPVCGKPVFINSQSFSLYELPRNEDDYDEEPEIPVYVHFSEGSKEVIIGIMLDSLEEHGEDFSNKIQEIENKNQVNQAIINFCENYNISIEENDKNFGMYLMLKYN